MVEGGLRNTHFFLGMSMLIGTKPNLYTWVAPLNKAYYEYLTIISKDCYFTIVQKQLFIDTKAGLWFEICLAKESGFPKIQKIVLLGYKVLKKNLLVHEDRNWLI